MSRLIPYLIEAGFVLAVLYVLYFLLLHMKAFPKFNRFYLLFSLLFSVLIPVVSIPLIYSGSAGEESLILPVTQVWNFLPELVISGSSYNNTNELSLITFNWLAILSVLYFTGTAISVANSCLKLLKLKGLICRFTFQPEKDDEGNSYLITNTNGQFPTFSFLNFIFWDNTCQLTKPEAEQIIRHELGHVRQKHTLDLLCLELMTALFWFHPLIYAYRRSIRQVHEHLADLHAIDKYGKDSYFRLMVKQTLQNANLPLVSSFFQHNTLNRIQMLQNKPTLTFFRAALVAGICGIIFFIAACEEEPKDPLSGNGTTQAIHQEGSPASLTKDSGQFFEEISENSDQIFEIVENQPTPKGGMEVFYKKIAEDLKYPKEAFAKEIEGRVYIQFVIDEEGAVSEVKTVKGVGHGLDEAAEEVIRNTNWNPGRQKGKAVRTRMVMPIAFEL